MQTKRARIEPAEGGAAAAASGVAAGGRRNVLDRLLRIVRPACVYHTDSIDRSADSSSPSFGPANTPKTAAASRVPTPTSSICWSSRLRWIGRHAMILCRPPHVARRRFNPSGLAFEGVLNSLPSTVAETGDARGRRALAALPALPRTSNHRFGTQCITFQGW